MRSIFLKLIHTLKIILKKLIGENRVGDKIEASKFKLDIPFENIIDVLKDDCTRNTNYCDIKISAIA